MKQKGGVRKLWFIYYCSFAPFIGYTCATQNLGAQNKVPFLLCSFFHASLLLLSKSLLTCLFSLFPSLVKTLEGAALPLPVIAVGGGTLVPMIPFKPVMKPH